MLYNVRLSEDSLNAIRRELGVDEGILYLKSGKVRVEKVETINSIAKKYKIESINGQRPDIIKDKSLVADSKSLSKEERYTLIGPMQIGSIVKIRYYSRVVYLVITDLDNNTFSGMSLNVRIPEKCALSGEGIVLEKNKDVLYKNLTHRNISLVNYEMYVDFSYKEILNVGSRIEGRVINANKLAEILALKKYLDEDFEGQEKN